MLFFLFHMHVWYMCIHVCMCVGVQVCSYGRPKLIPGVFLGPSSASFVELWSHPTPEKFCLWSSYAGGPCLCLPSLELQGSHQVHLAFPWVLWIWTPVFTAVQVLQLLSHLPSPAFFFKGHSSLMRNWHLTRRKRPYHISSLAKMFLRSIQNVFLYDIFFCVPKWMTQLILLPQSWKMLRCSVDAN